MRPAVRIPALAIALLVGAVAAAHAASPFGVGLPEPAPSAGGFLPGLFAWIAAEQSRFYRALTETVRAMKADGSAGVWLMALSFAYGVLHAAGPGHGKAIVSAYVLANRETARNGAILAVLSALAQAVTAIVLVSVAAIALGATSMAMTAAARLFEIGSFALVTLLGLWLVQRKIVRPLAAALADRYRPVTVPVGSALAFAGPAAASGPHPDGAHSAHAHHDHGHHGHGHHGHGHGHGHDHHRHIHAHHDHGVDAHPLHAGHDGHASHPDHHHDHGPDCGCGHAHVPPAAAVTGPLDLGKAWTTILAVGLRPCTGALIVLVFALSQGLFAAGVAATVAMAIGTGLTVAALTLLTVSARGLALRLAGGRSRTASVVHQAAEGLGALLVLGFGLLMLGASLAG